MTVVETVGEFRGFLDQARAAGSRVGLVPTMGYLHEGHVSLMQRSARECDVTAVTIFVNPLQFGASEDLSTYPRDLPRDLEVCETAGVALVLAPAVEEVYPEPMLTSVSVAGLSDRLEGTARPTHFDGVATVVAKLFNFAGHCSAYFGEKDYQQLAIIRTMARDLSFPVEVIACPTVREPDGLAKSSRNVYLNADERVAATVLFRALEAGVNEIESGQRSSIEVRTVMAETISTEPLATLDYAEVIDAATLQVLDPLQGELRLLVATKFGVTRLIDNVGLTIDS